MGVQEVFDILVFSVRDGFVQVSAFVAFTVLLFSYVQYKSGGRLISYLEANRNKQPVAGALLGLTPGCGGAIIAMPLYIRGTVSFGTVVAALAATAGDSAFVILALAPEAALWAYGMAFIVAVLFGYAIDLWGLGITRLDRAIRRLGEKTQSPRLATSSVYGRGPHMPDIHHRTAWRDPSYEHYRREYAETGFSGAITIPGEQRGQEPGDAGLGADESALSSASSDSEGGIMRKITHVVHGFWWILAMAALAAGVMYLVRGAPEVPLEVTPTFFGLFTVAGLTGTITSFYLHFVGRHYISEGDAGRVRDDFGSTYETLKHAALETSMVTVWVIAAYLIYEYGMSLFALDIRTLAAAVGLLAPVAGALLGLIPGCAPQIVFAGIYAEGAIPFSALAANAISQDGDALFPLMAIDLKAALIATIYTTIPALIVGILLHYIWPFAQFGFGVIGG